MDTSGKDEPGMTQNYDLHVSMGDKSVETLGSKIRFLSVLVTLSPLPPKQCWFFCFFHCKDRSAYTTLNWGNRGIREKMLDENKIEQQMLKDVRAHCYCISLVRTLFIGHAHATSKTQQNIERMTFALTRCANIFVGCSVTPLFFWQITSFSDSFHHTKKQKKSVCGKF